MGFDCPVRGVGEQRERDGRELSWKRQLNVREREFGGSSGKPVLSEDE
jgi:hypothetical protein